MGLGSGDVYAICYWIMIALWGLLEVFGASPRRQASSRRDALRKDRGSYILLVASLFLGIFLGGLLTEYAMYANIDWNRPAIMILAISVMAAGIVFRQYAIHVLGRYFTVDVAVSADQRVVQEGPYHWIRHPAYTGTLIIVIGMGLGMLNWLSMTAILAGYFIGHLYRIQVEEHALLESIGQPYRDYCQRTKRLIPKIF